LRFAGVNSIDKAYQTLQNAEIDWEDTMKERDDITYDMGEIAYKVEVLCAFEHADEHCSESRIRDVTKDWMK
jgi:hypothetical protein